MCCPMNGLQIDWIHLGCVGDLGMAMLFRQVIDSSASIGKFKYRGTSLIRKRPHPQGHHMSLGTVLV